MLCADPSVLLDISPLQGENNSEENYWSAISKCISLGKKVNLKITEKRRVRGFFGTNIFPNHDCCTNMAQSSIDKSG